MPGVPLPVPVPVAHMDRKPSSSWEQQTFTYTEATEWDEHWVGIDVPVARRLANSFIDTFTEFGQWNTPLIPFP